VITDALPRAAGRRADYLRSDHLHSLSLPAQELLRARAEAMEGALADDDRGAVEVAAQAFALVIARAADLAPPEVAVLGTRPHRTEEGRCVYEKFGDYDLQTGLIRVWMRTAMRRQVSAYGALLHTLCHEVCHHLDVVGHGLPDTPHTRGFYERTALLYHHARGTPPKPLYWVALSGGKYRLDWRRTMTPRP
jgi:hypothetical protein